MRDTQLVLHINNNDEFQNLGLGQKASNNAEVRRKKDLQPHDSDGHYAVDRRLA